MKPKLQARRCWPAVVGAAAAVLGGGLLLAAAQAQSGDPLTPPALSAATVAEPVPEPRPLVPAPPEDARAAKVYVTFDTYCARCHQTGKITFPAPARPMANILALDELAREPGLVTPGLPDASPLYTVLLRRHPALDLEQAPGADEIQAVRDWIQELPPTTGACNRRPTSRQAETEQAVMAALAEISEEKRKEVRFVSLGHLADACETPQAMAGYRQAVTKILNTLTWGPEPIRIETVDSRGTILRIMLGEFGWVAAHWEKLVQSYPYASLASSRLTETIRRQTGTTTPIVRGDWLAQAAMATPAYAQLLGLPGRMANLQRILNVDIDADQLSGKARRAGVGQSAVTRANRIVDRHPTRAGSLWLAYDFASSEGRQNVQAFPFGPSATSTVKVPFRHDSTRSLFTLPNGFFAYSLNDARGDRIEAPPENIDRDEASWAGGGSYGASCMGCHRGGPIGVKDSVRAALSADASLPQTLRDQIQQLYAPQAEIDTLVSEDQERYAAAQRKVGIDPSLLIQGLDPATALARAYTREVGLRRLAAEADLTLAEARIKIASLPSELALSARRVLASTATRAEADRILQRLAPDAGSADTAVVVASPPEPRPDLELIVWSQSDVYEAGQLATFHARANAACYLTLVSVDRAGQATVLFPNEFEQNNLLAADSELTLPAPTASYQFRVREKGRETLVGICQTVAKSPAGILHDFERQRFTMLGDWRSHLAQSAVAVASPTAAPGQPVRSRRARRLPPPVPVPQAAPSPDAKPVPDLQARTAITYEIR